MVLLATPPAFGKVGRRPAYAACDCDSSGLGSVVRDCHANEGAKNNKTNRRKDKNLLRDIATAESCLAKPKDTAEEGNIYRCEGERGAEGAKGGGGGGRQCVCDHVVPLEDPNDPRGCLYFQANVHVLRHSTTICPGFQCSVHVGNVRQTAIVEGIMSGNSELRAGQSAAVVFRFARCPEYLVRGRRLLFTAGLGTRGIGRITQLFPYLPST